MTEFLQNVINSISAGSTYALIALGIALVFGMMKLVNLAYGELIMIGGYVMYGLAGVPWAIAIVLTIVVTAFAALLMERVAFRPVRGADATTLLITSFVLGYFLQNLALVIFGSIPKALEYPGFVSKSIDFGALSISQLNLVTISVTLLLLAALVVFLRKTPLGVQMRAAAEDFTMARLLGVKANRVIMAAFALSGIVAGVIGVLYLANLGTVSYISGFNPLLVGVVATVTGGLGSLLGAAIGGYAIGFLQVFLQAYLPSGAAPWRDTFVFGVVILILLFRPQGIIPGSAAPARA
jgi:branched-chain amino acid transport system permease protein